jgi:hypothetical protein
MGSPTTGNMGELQRDISRTFPAHQFFKAGEPGEIMLTRILTAVILSCPDVGYCQVSRCIRLIYCCHMSDLFIEGYEFCRWSAHLWSIKL